MKRNLKLIAAFVFVAVLSAALAGAAMWWYTPSAPAGGAAAAAAAPKPAASKHPRKYVSLDKVIVMLRRAPGETEAHYVSVDLVLATTEDKEKQTKEHLPLLRSIAVRSLSSYALSAAASMTVEQFAAQLNRSFEASYAKDKIEKPFAEVMIGKLIIE
jgi:flagellar FliL protein